MNALTAILLSWLLTYAIHSTILMLAARLAASRWHGPSARDVIWKAALVGGIVTATIQTGFAIQPRGTLPVPGAAARLTAEPPMAAPTAGAPTATDRAAGDRAAPDIAAPDIAAPDIAADERGAGRADGAGAHRTDVSGTVGPGITVAAGAVVVWAVVALALAVAYGARRLILVGRLGDRRPVERGAFTDLLVGLSGDRGRRHIALTSSRTISSPVALGLREICVPEAALTDLGEEEQRSLLAHELAHLDRYDPVWLDAASVIERLFFFQPLNRMARREMQSVAEYLCDEWAATRLGSGVPLARCLARVAEWIQASPLGVPVAGMAEQRSQLVERIARLTEPVRSSRPLARGVAAAGTVLILAVTVAAAPGVQSPRRAGGNALQSDGGAGPGTGTTTAAAPQGGDANATVVAALIERLKDTDAGVRRAAASSLGNLRSRSAVMPLIATIADPDRDTRVAVIEALGNLHDTHAINRLLDALRDRSVQVRRAALGALDDFESEELTAGPMIPALKDADAEVRERAAHLLGSIKDRVAVGPLTAALDDPVADVRRAAIDALGNIRAREAAGDVHRALGDADADVRAAALDALDAMKAPIPETPLLALLADASPDVRQKVAEYLHDHPMQAAVPGLIRLLDDPNRDVRVNAVSALGEVRNPAADRAVRGALTSTDPKVRARAAEILGERP